MKKLTTEQEIYRFNYNDRYYEYDDKELYEDFLMGLDYDTVSINDKYIEIIFENGNELKLKLL